MARPESEAAGALRDMGYRPMRRAKHGHLWRHPSGATVQLAGTVSDTRSTKNTLAAARRALRLTTHNKEN